MIPTPSIIDPLLNVPAEVRFIQPFQARKEYVCPECTHEIAIGTGHYVVVPVDSPDLRRHWHRRCLERKLSAPQSTRTQR